MKIVLFTDPHLGLKLPHSRVSADQVTSDRLEDVVSIFEQIDELATEVSADQVFCLGDLFDRAHPTAPVLIRAARELKRLTSPDPMGVPQREVFVLPGNHDAHGKSGEVYSLDMYTELEVPGLTILQHGSPILSIDDMIRFHPIPWCPTKLFRERVKACGSLQGTGRASYDVLLIHQTVKGAKDGTWVAKRGIDAATFKGFDLVLSGHIHEPQTFPNGRYLGNPLHLRMTDVNSKRGAWVLDTDTLAMEFVPLRYPEFIRWSFADDDELSVLDIVREQLTGLLEELDTILDDNRDVYLDVKIEGDRDGVYDASRLVRKYVDERKEPEPDMGRIRSSRIITSPYELIAPSERMGVVADIAEKGKVATPGDLVRAFVQVQSGMLPGDAKPDAFETVGAQILDHVNAASFASGSGSFIDFASISIESFGVFSPRQTVDLLEAGQVIVLGNNEDTTAADSNGAGKTTVFKALSWCLFGRTIDGLTTNVRHIGDKKAIVSITFVVADTWYRVTRSRTPSTGKLQLFERVDGEYEDKSRRSSRDTQIAIEDLIGLDWDAFRCTVLFGQGDHRRFAAPTLTDAARKAVLSVILRLGVYDAAKKYAGELRKSHVGSADTCKREADKLDREIADIRAKRAGVVGRLDTLKEVRDDGASRLRVLEEKLATAKGLFETLSASVLKKATEVDEADRDHREVDALCKKVDDLRSKRSSANGKACRAADALATEGPCSECGKPREYDRGAHSDAEDRQEITQRKANEARDLLEAYAKEEDEARAHLADCERDLRVTKRKRDAEKTKRDSLKERVTESTASLASAGKEISTCEGKIDEHDAEIKKLEDRVQSHLDEEKTHRENATVAKWWINGFGAKGIPAYAIEQSLPILNKHANRHLAALTDGDIVIRWSPTTEGSKGTVKEELSMSITVEGVEGPASSGGQYKKIELATEVALGDMMSDREGSATNLIVFDEVFDGLDREGRSRVLDWLGTLPQESQYVVSHRSDVADDFETVLLVTKNGGHATIEVYE